MRWLELVVVIVVGCGSSDDSSSGSGGGTEGTGDGSGPTSPGSTASGSASGSGAGTSDTGSTGSSGVSDSASGGVCDGEFLCVGYDEEAACVDDPCCRPSFGRVYEEQKTDWCLGATAEYVGCSTLAGNDDCDFVGTIVCGSADDPEPPFYVELDSECFPNGCAVSQPPAEDIEDCP